MVGWHDAMRTDYDDLLLGMREEWELNGSKVESLRESNEAGVFYEAAMTYLSVGI